MTNGHPPSWLVLFAPPRRRRSADRRVWAALALAGLVLAYGVAGLTLRPHTAAPLQGPFSYLPR